MVPSRRRSRVPSRRRSPGGRSTLGLRRKYSSVHLALEDGKADDVLFFVQIVIARGGGWLVVGAPRGDGPPPCRTLTSLGCGRVGCPRGKGGAPQGKRAVVRARLKNRSEIDPRPPKLDPRPSGVKNRRPTVRGRSRGHCLTLFTLLLYSLPV